MTKYFTTCNTIEEVKATYKKMAMLLHPDCNKDKDTTAAFQEMNAEYQDAFARCKNTFTNAKGDTYTKENNETAKQYSDIIDKIIHFEDCKIEIIGNWIWITGNTRTYKEVLKELKFTWSAKKGAWSYHNDTWRKKSHKYISLDEIRNMYGSEEIKTESRKKITA